MMCKKYVVRVNENNNIFDVKTDVNQCSFQDMKAIYNKTKEYVKSGIVSLILICNNVESVVYSKQIHPQKDKVDEVIDSLVENLEWLLTYKENANEVMSAIDMSRDAHLKKIELYSDDFNFTETDTKNSIFDELQEILALRRKIKYSKLLVDTIANQINLKRVKDVIINSRNIIQEKPSVNVSPSKVDILEKEVIKDVFDIEGINKIKQLKRDNDKIILLNNSITPIKKVSQDSTAITKPKENPTSNESINQSNSTMESVPEIDTVQEEVLYKGNSYKKLKDCKIAFKRDILENFKSLTPQLKSKYNYISKIGDKIYGYIFKQEYKGMALVEKLSKFTDSTINKKNKEYNKVLVVNGELYCLSKGIS